LKQNNSSYFKTICFQCQLGQTKVVFENQGKKIIAVIAFSIGYFLFKSGKVIEVKYFKVDKHLGVGHLGRMAE
jgi:hypothetical protein